VDDPPHMCTGAGMTRLGWNEVKNPSMGLGWHARIGAGLSTKGPRGSGVIQGVPWATMRDGSHQSAVQNVSQMLVEYTSSEC